MTLVRDLPPGLIGVPCGTNARHNDFVTSILAMQKPPNSMFRLASGLGPAAPLNEIGKVFLDTPHLKWLFLTNDDNLCPVDTIPRLLEHRQSVVTGLYFGRHMPFEPVLYDKDWRAGYSYIRRRMRAEDSGLINVAGCGDGCLMIQRRVLEAIPYPWWEYGLTLTDQCDHDLMFCDKLAEHGFNLVCDTDVRVDHVTSITVRPSRNEDGSWETNLMQGDGRISLQAPQAGRHD